MVNKYVNENDIQFIFNVPYCPEYNPIENVFSQVKQIIKMKKNNQKQLLKNVTNAFKKVTKQDLHKYYKNSLNF
jgi:transposase